VYFRPSHAGLLVGWFGLFNKINVKEDKVIYIVGVHFRTSQTFKKHFIQPERTFLNKRPCFSGG